MSELEAAVAAFVENAANQKRWPDEKDRRQVAFAICNAQLKAAEEHRSFSVQLGEAEKDGWVHMLPLGEYVHPIFGTIVIDEPKINNMIDNFKNDVRGTQLDIDYAHKMDPAKGEKAAGWIQNLELRDDGLWGKIDWTDTALEEIKKGEWKYMSVEYDDKWCENKKDGECYEDVLFGAALTNRPFMKDLTPINLSDLFTLPEGKFAQDDAHYGPALNSMRRCANCAFFRDGACLIVDGEIDDDYTSDYFTPVYNDASDGLLWFTDRGEVTEKVDRKQLCELLGLAEDATDEQIQARIKGLSEGNRKVVEALKFDDVSTVKTEDVLNKIKELTEQPKPAENPEEAKARKFAEDFPEEAKQLEETRKELADTKAEKQLSEWHHHKESHFGLPPALDDKAKELIPNPKFIEFMDELVKTGFVDFSEKGGGNPPAEEDTAKDKFLSEVNNFIKEQKEAGTTVSFSEAVTHISRTQPALAEAYRKSTKPIEATS